MATKEPIIEPCGSPTPEFIHDELIEGSADLMGNHDDDLLFRNPLPDQLFQSDEKDGEGDSNSADDLHKNADHPIKADDDNIQEQNKVRTAGILCILNFFGENFDFFSVKLGLSPIHKFTQR